MKIYTSIAAAVAIAAASANALAESRWNARLAGVVDEQESSSIDADLSFSPMQTLQLAVGAGSTNAASTAGAIRGTSLRGSADVQAGRVALRGYYRQWTSPRFDTATWGAQLATTAHGFTAGLVGEARRFDVDYQSGGSNPQRASERFKGTGIGGVLKYSRSGWSAYADAMFYQYGSLTRYVENESPGFTPTAGSATGGEPPSLRDAVASLPMNTATLNPLLPDLSQAVLTTAPGLTTSAVTLGEGALDRLLSVGLERGFTRWSLRLEWTGAKDAILDSSTSIYRSGVGYVVNEHLDVSLLGGVVDSYAGSSAFAGVSLGLRL